MLTTFNEVDMKPIMDLRAKYKDSFAKFHEVNLGFMSFFTKAVTEALNIFPAVNAQIYVNEFILHIALGHHRLTLLQPSLFPPVLLRKHRLPLSYLLVRDL
jgi:pyruvate/2-oxoglutarate dehydrogenase complex dihydrolipoamide acyltransferase (E2) component